ncbi:MAG: universal stress protein [Dissulfurispiraceae bacterium]
MESSQEVCHINRHILIAADESDNANRAVSYVARMLGGLKGYRVTLINIVPVPPDDFFLTAEERLSWMTDKETKSKIILENYRNMLIESGFEGDTVEGKMKSGDFPSVARAILEEAAEIAASTIVLGRRGISKKEEFIFGSTSNKILHSRKSCAALWVIE